MSHITRESDPEYMDKTFVNNDKNTECNDCKNWKTMRNLYNGETPYRDYVYNPRDYIPRRCTCGCKKVEHKVVDFPVMQVTAGAPQTIKLNVLRCKNCLRATTGNATMFGAVQEWNRLNCIREYSMGDYEVKINSYNLTSVHQIDGMIDEIELSQHEISVDKDGYFIITVASDSGNGDFEYRFKLESIREIFPG